MGSMTENIADKAINDTRIVKQFTNPVKEPIDSDINLFDLLDNRAKRDPEGAMIEYKGDDGTWHPYSAQVFRDMVIDLAKAWSDLVSTRAIQSPSSRAPAGNGPRWIWRSCPSARSPCRCKRPTPPARSAGFSTIPKSRSPSPKMTGSVTRSNPCAMRCPPCATCS